MQQNSSAVSLRITTLLSISSEYLYSLPSPAYFAMMVFSPVSFSMPFIVSTVPTPVMLSYAAVKLHASSLLD